MKADGRPRGCWIYTGVYARGVNQAKRRRPGDQQSWVAPSGGGRGRPTAGSSTTGRRPTPTAARGATARPTSGGTERQALDGPRRAGLPRRQRRLRTDRPWNGRAGGPAGDDPFIMQSDGKGWLFAPAGLSRPSAGALRARESPCRNPHLLPAGQPDTRGHPARTTHCNPSPPGSGGDVYPYVFTTYGLTEHHTAGGMSRWLPYLAELQPEFSARFARVGPRRGLEHRGMGDDRHRPHRDRGAGPRHRPRSCPLKRRRSDASIRSVCPTTGGSATGALSTGDSRQRPVGRSFDRTSTSRRTKPRPAISSPVDGRRGPALLRYVDGVSVAGLTSRQRRRAPGRRDAEPTATVP